MKTKHLFFSVTLSALLAGAVLAQYEPRPPAGSNTSTSKNEPSGSKVVALGGIEKATPISPEEAAQKYPPRGGKYPTAELTQGPNTGYSSAVVQSPYPPHHKFDTTGIPRGGLVLDPYAKHVFIKP